MSSPVGIMIALTATMPEEHLILFLQEEIQRYKASSKTRKDKLELGMMLTVVANKMAVQLKGGDELEGALDILDKIEKNAAWAKLNPLNKETQS